MITCLTENTSADLGLRDAARTVIGRAKAALGQALASRKARYEAQQVLGCEERVLRDMGISRGDLRHAIED